MATSSQAVFPSKSVDGARSNSRGGDTAGILREYQKKARSRRLALGEPPASVFAMTAASGSVFGRIPGAHEEGCSFAAVGV
jgi:hypothetical protein